MLTGAIWHRVVGGGGRWRLFASLDYVVLRGINWSWNDSWANSITIDINLPYGEVQSGVGPNSYVKTIYTSNMYTSS